MNDSKLRQHFAVIGKICRVFDDGGVDRPHMKGLVANLFAQAARADQFGFESHSCLSTFAARLQKCLQVGAGELQSAARDMANAYLVACVAPDLTIQPGNPTHTPTLVKAIQEELISEKKTLTVRSESRGLVHFFETNFPVDGQWPTAPDSNADFSDSEFVVTGFVYALEDPKAKRTASTHRH